MPARVDRRADPFAATGRSDIGKPLACCRAHLLELVQCVCARLFEEGPPLLSKLDRLSQRDGPRYVRHLTYHFQGRIFTASWLEVQTEGFGQLQLRYSQVVLRRNKVRKLIV